MRREYSRRVVVAALYTILVAIAEYLPSDRLELQATARLKVVRTSAPRQDSLDLTQPLQLVLLLSRALSFRAPIGVVTVLRAVRMRRPQTDTFEARIAASVSIYGNWIMINASTNPFFVN